MKPTLTDACNKLLSTKSMHSSLVSAVDRLVNKLITDYVKTKFNEVLYELYGIHIDGKVICPTVSGGNNLPRDIIKEIITTKVTNYANKVIKNDKSFSDEDLLYTYQHMIKTEYTNQLAVIAKDVVAEHLAKQSFEFALDQLDE